MRNSSVSRERPGQQSPPRPHPFFSTRTSQPSSPVRPRPPTQVLDALLKETFTNISHFATQPTNLEAHPSIIIAYERLSTGNVLPDQQKEKSPDLKTPQSSPFHSTAASNSLPPHLTHDQFAGVCFPTTPAVAINLLGRYLTNNEVSEILSYKLVYYLGVKADKIKGDLSQPNYGYDDERNDYKIVPSDHLDYRYEVLDVIGKGAFGRVIRCLDHKEGTQVAVKIIRNARKFHRQAMVEIQVLKTLRGKSVQYAVNLYDNFKFRGHECMVFELLDISLYDYLKINRFRGFPLLWVRTVTQQLISVLLELKLSGIIHCDIKPENILFQDSRKGSVKLIDFGSACVEHERMYSYIQSRFYRAPEVILGVRYSFPIDMWSLGCVISELYTGRPLFPGENEGDQFLWIMSVLGMPPDSLLTHATKKGVFYAPDGTVKVVPDSHGIRRQPGSTTLSRLIPSSDPGMMDFISSMTHTGCLEWEPERRLTPEEASQHPFLV